MSQADDRRLPVVIGPRPNEERRSRGRDGSLGAACLAQLIGQAGAARGLRGGRAVVDKAHSAYRTSEWSGSADRRRTRGVHALTSA